MNIEIEFKQFEELRNRLQKYIGSGGIDKFAIQFLNDMADRALEMIRARTPVDTGLLQSSWQKGQVIRYDGYYEIEIFNLVDYARYVEQGHLTSNGARWITGRFMMSVSMRVMEREMPAILEQRLSKELNKIIKG